LYYFNHFAAPLNKISSALGINSIANSLFVYFILDGRPAPKKKEKI
jgi:hypothetical protein